MAMNVEVWQPVPSVAIISASSWGRVLLQPSVVAMPNGGVRAYSTRPVWGAEEKTATARAGSPKRRIIRVNKLGRRFKVHRLVCEAFHGPQPSPEHIVLHLDEDPSNNRSDNLRWGTREENMNFPKVVAAFKNRVGEKSPGTIHRNKAKATP